MLKLQEVVYMRRLGEAEGKEKIIIKICCKTSFTNKSLTSLYMKKYSCTELETYKSVRYFSWIKIFLTIKELIL